MHISLSALVAFALPFGITAERYIVTCGDGQKACSPSTLKALQDAGATVIDNFPFGVVVIEADADLDPVVSNVTITLDLEMQLEKTEDVAAILTDFAPLYQGSNTSKAGNGGRRRLQMKPPPLSGDDGKYTTSICGPMFLSSDMIHRQYSNVAHDFFVSMIVISRLFV
jgi:hypothetical protein